MFLISIAKKKMRGYLFDAIKTHDLNEVKRLINQKEVDVTNLYDQLSFCPLVMIIQERWLEGVEYLVNAKANVNACDDLGWSCLQEACFLGGEGMEKITRFLLQNGARADRKGYMGDYPIHTATSDRSVASLKEICHVTEMIDVENGNGETALNIAILRDNELAAAVLLDHGAKIEKTDEIFKIWFTQLVNQRRSLKKTLIVLFACAKPMIAKDVAKLLISMVWSTRDDPNWKIKSKKR